MNEPDTTHAFDGKAEAYARHRLDYSPVAIEAITAIAGLGKASVIADLGAGTGMLTRHFAERVGRVFAIEPNSDMRALALASLGKYASVRTMEGSAQEMGLPDHSIDAVLAGRAIKWFDAAPAQAEIRRVLRPGGWLIVVQTPVKDAYSCAALDCLRDESTGRHDGIRRRMRPRVNVAVYFEGDNYIRLSYPCAAQETWPEFLGRMQSLSFSPQAGDPQHAGFERRARAIFDGGAVDGRLRVEYATEVLMKQIVPPVAVPRSLPFLESEIEGDIVKRFERVAAGAPDSTALKADDGAWTYAQLDALANQVAEIVVRDSPDRSKPVALLFDHGVGGVAGIMGVLKAGRAYCAISPAHPVERHRQTLADLQPVLLLCAGSRVGMARDIASPGLHCEVIDPRAMRGSDRRLDIKRCADDIAAIYYTSGTTGRPKGVMLSHRHLLHRAWLSGRMLEIAVGDPISQIKEISFASSANDIFAALMAGATICPFDARTRSLRQLALWLRHERIAILRIPIALFHHFIDSLDGTERFPHVRYLQPAGKLEWNGLDRYRKHFGRECRLVRQLAATETSLLTAMMVDHDTPRVGATVPVGYPVAGKEIWLEAENGARAGVNEIGEIVVKSRYLYSGIWQRPETFQPPGEARTHRMGDLGRWVPNGSLEFIGRTDSRVKIRGFTVDLEQVEAAVVATGLVIDAAVVAKDDGSRDARLVAYVVPASRRVTPGEIRVRLTERVPAYMIPSHFAILDVLPLTPNGKIDRAALPEVERERPGSAMTYVAPRTAMEKSIGAIWTEVLKIDPIGVEDDFLEIGGDSLIAARIASRILIAFCVDLAPRDLFDAPTIARMADLVVRRQREARDREDQ